MKLKLKSPVIVLLTVLMVLQSALFGLPAFAGNGGGGGTNPPLIQGYCFSTYYDPSGANSSTGTNQTFGSITQVPYIFSSNAAIRITFTTNVTTNSFWTSNTSVFQMLDASNNSVSIKVDRDGDPSSGAAQAFNERNNIFVIPQVPLQPATSYKIIVGPTLTSNNTMQAGVQQEVYFTTAPDITIPTWSANKTLTASNVSSSSLTLSWSGATDDVGVTGYKVFENGNLLDTINDTTTTYNVTGLNANTAYSFQVQALDAASNLSTSGPTASATTTSATTNVNVSLNLNKTSAVAGASVTASGTADPNKWLSIKAIDSANNIVFFDAVKTNTSGSYSDTFIVPTTAQGNLTVVTGYGSNVACANLTVAKEITSDITIADDGSNKNLAITSNTPNVSVTVPAGVTGTSISVSNLLTANASGVSSSALPALNITASTIINTIPVQVAVYIPRGTIVSAPTSWDGTINVPTVQPNNTITVTPDSGKTATVGAVIEVGYGDVPLTFSKAVRILIPGQAGNDAGYYRNGTFTKITTVMAADSQDAGDALAAGGDGKISVGSDLVIWTKHFTQFVTYTQTSNGSTDSPGPGGGGGGGSDTQAPTWPSGAQLNGSSSQGTVTLNWTSATDNVRVTGYKIFQGTTLVGSVDGNTTTFTYSFPQGSGSGQQTYTVQAGDAAGNWTTDGPSKLIGGTNPVEYQGSFLTTINGTSSTTGISVESSSNVPVMPTIKLVFGRNVAHDSIWADNRQCITMQDSSGANIQINVFRLSGDPGSEERHNIFIQPLSNLTAGKTYKIIISPNLKANNGITLGQETNNQNKVITFTVAGGSTSITTSGPTSATGTASVNPAVGATVALGDSAKVVIPANALKETAAVTVKVQKVESPPAAPANAKPASDVYEFTVGNNNTYSFATNVGITLSFNASAIGSGEVPSVFNYDEAQKKWINIGGGVSGSTITVQVNHFTKYAVFAVKKTEIPVLLKDIGSHWAAAKIRKLVALNVISGYPDGNFKPDSSITRAEFATMLVKAFKLDVRKGRLFKDTANHWAKDYISTAAESGIVNGYQDGSFRPDDLINREEMAVMIVQAAKLNVKGEEISFADRSNISKWANNAIATAVKNGIMNGYPGNTIRPHGKSTRSKAVTVIVNALEQ